MILLLHGFPTSSNMFRNLIPRLAGSFRVIAPDYPGYGQSSMPDHKTFEYTFENLREGCRRIRRVSSAQQVLDVRDGLRRTDWLPTGAAASGADSGIDRAERQCIRGRACSSSGTRSRNTGPTDCRKPRSLALPGDAKSTHWQYENGVSGHVAARPDNLAGGSGRSRSAGKSGHPDGPDALTTGRMFPSIRSSRRSSASISRRR